MVDLRYEAPETLQAAVALLAGASGPARILAGGTDVIVQMETDLIEPQLLVDIKKIPEVRQIKAENGGFRIGAAASGMEIMQHAALCKAWPGVIDGVKLIGSIQVKGRASVGGNLCNGSPAADSVPAMIAAGAVARIIGPDGTREVPVEEIPTGPGKTSLRKGEIRRRLPAVRAAHRDGHRGSGCRRQPHSRWQRHLHGRALRVGSGRANHHAGKGSRCGFGGDEGRRRSA